MSQARPTESGIKKTNATRDTPRIALPPGSTWKRSFQGVKPPGYSVTNARSAMVENQTTLHQPISLRFNK
jgi:hypothetical protein